MQLSPDPFLAPKWPRDLAGLSFATNNLAQCPNCLSDHSPCSTNQLSVAGTIAVLSIHVTILENLASKSLTAMGNRLIDSVISFRRSISQLADRVDPT